MRYALVVGLAALAVAGCARDPRVARVYDGHVVEGRFIAPDAYAAYLQGALADAAGDLPGALAAYRRAIDEDEEDPELEARVGDVQCRLDPKDPAADAAFTKARKIDPASAAALGAQARCELLRGHAAEATALAERAAEQDPHSASFAALALLADAKAEAGRAPEGGARAVDPAARARAVALT
ncbi:MAG: Tetratricopeptide 2 repeat protein, partial [Labilithrix sp.]|nr:Tetratricopeptide 2 repeat protein [Labilithrix sp.]